MDGQRRNPWIDLIHSASEDVTKVVDITERSLRGLSRNPYIKDRAEEPRSPFDDLRRATGIFPEVVRIPRNCEKTKEYCSRPQLHLDWILTTDPSKPRAAKEAPIVEKTKGIPTSEWIFDTKKASQEHVEYEKTQPAPPITKLPRPKMDLEWILSTRPSHAVLTRVVEPMGKGRKVPTSEWIFRTDPDFHSDARYDEQINSMEDFKHEFAYLDEDKLIRTASVLSDRMGPPTDERESMQLRTARSAA